MSQPLLIDLGQVSCGCANHALEELHKAVAAPPDDDDLLWRPHENPLIREHLEDCTQRIGARLQQMLDVLLGVLQGHAIPQDLLKAHSWTRWTDAERRAAARTLEGKSPSEYSLEDWLTLVDLILQRYLPDGAIAEEAEYLSARAQLAGQVQAALPPDLHLETTLLRLATTLPATLAATGRIGALAAPLQRTVAKFAQVRAAELIADLGDAVRRQIKAAIIDHHEALALGETRSYQQLEQRLRDQFGALNRDWRRIAITEVGRDANEGFLASLPVGSRVRRVEVYKGACPFCRRINGLVLTLVSPDKPDKDGWAEVWVGKTNVGRSASPRKRSASGALVEREPHELWWPAAGLQHPNCRGRWLPMPDAPPPGVDPKFAAWLEGELAKLHTS